MYCKKKFRGYSSALQKWFYGDLVQYYKFCGITHRNDELVTDIQTVDPESVTQLIPQRTDIHGKELYEGDIVRLRGRWAERMESTYGIILSDSCIIEEGVGRVFPQDMYQYELVGNVFENLDILDEKTQKRAQIFMRTPEDLEVKE